MVCSIVQGLRSDLVPSTRIHERPQLVALHRACDTVIGSSRGPKRTGCRLAATGQPVSQRLKSVRCASSTDSAVDLPTIRPKKKSLLSGQSLASIPFGLLVGLSVTWACTLRCGVVTQTSTLLLLDIVYAGLHLQPLLPLLQHSSSPDVAFMHCYTRAWYFVSECLVLLWLLGSQVIRQSVPGVILAAHGVVHIGFVGLAGLAPGWCMQQQMKRIQNGWNTSGLVGIWHTLVNMLNCADLFLHVCYIVVLWKGLQRLTAAGQTLALWQHPEVVASLGVVLAYLMAQWLPQRQYRQHTQKGT